MRRLPRRTRREQAHANEQRLLDAAFEVFTTYGYHSATLDRIAEAAGLTTGAVYSRYAGKAELLLALIERTIGRRIAALRQLRDCGEPDVSTAWEQAWWTSVLERPEWMLLVIEFRTHAARDSGLNARYAALHERLVEALAAVLAEDAEREETVLTVPATEVARMLMALAAGMVLERWSMGQAFDAGLPLRASGALGQGLVRPAAARRGGTRKNAAKR